MDAGALLIGEINYVLDRSDFEEQIVKTISEENTSEYKCDKRDWKLQKSEIRGLAPVGADLKKFMIQKVDRRRLIARDILLIFDSF